MEIVTYFIFLGSKITADSGCGHEIKRHCPYLDNVLKSRDITLLTKVHTVKAVVFPVVMYGCDSWTIKKAEHQRIDAFKLWCWRRLLRVPWTARRSNQSTLKEINPEYSLEGLMLKLKLQYFGHLVWIAMPECMLSCFSHVWLFVTPWTIVLQDPLSMGFSRQDYWSGLLCPPPGYLPHPGIEPVSLMPPALASGSFTISTTWEAPVKSQFIGKDPDVGKDWRQKEKQTAEDEMVGWHHWFSAHEFEQTPGESGGQRSMACHSPWGGRVRLSDWITITSRATFCGNKKCSLFF